MKNDRLTISLITGAILGIFCIIGISLRMGLAGNELFILATWVNRVVLGLVIGLAPRLDPKNTSKILLRGAFLGLMISGSFYLATSFKDTTGFFAGIAYGIIIEYMAARYSR